MVDGKAPEVEKKPASFGLEIYSILHRSGISAAPAFVQDCTRGQPSHPNSADFIECMDKLLPEAKRQMIEGARAKGKTLTAFYLVMDRAKWHWTKASLECLAKHGFTPVDRYPPRSSDLNPIENLWTGLDDRLDALVSENIDELKQQIKDQYAALVSERSRVYQGLCVHYCRRLKEVLLMDGDMTHY